MRRGATKNGDSLRIKRSASGERLYRDFRVRVVIPSQKDIVWRSHPPAGRGWNEDDLDKMLDQVADHLEKRFPSIEFRVVELAPNHCNFIYEGRKEYTVEAPNLCPEVARSVEIATLVCAKEGHQLGVFQSGVQITPQGPVPTTLNFCTKCGFGLGEVRGEMDRAFTAAVGNEVNKRLAAAASANKPAPVGEPDKKIAEMPPTPMA